MPDDLNLNLVIVIVFLVIGAIRWVIENVTGRKKTTPSEHWEEYDYTERADTNRPQFEPDTTKDLYEQARGVILERQNRHLPQQEVVAKKLEEYSSPPAAPPPIPGRVSISKPVPSQPVPAKEEEEKRALSEVEKEAVAAFEAHSSRSKNAATTSAQSRVRELLATPSAARDAIVLAEILGPPKGIR